MNVIGLGTDIVNINRIQKIYSKYGNQFLDKILTESEKKIEKKTSKLKNIATIAKRFAAKEAISKVEELRGVASDMQTWESILSQIQQAEEGDNKK